VNRKETYQVPKGTGKTKSGITKKESQPLATAPRPLPEGELVVSFYDSAKELLSTETFALTKENQWETLSFSTKAEQKGYISAKIQGTSSEPVKFDDFSIQLKSVYQAKLYQENHYYPFGMNMKGLESSDKQTQQNKKEHEWQFNAQTEREENFGLFWDETPFRPMDSQLGRFWGVDLMAETMASMTPFHYGFNNPIAFNDPTGLEPLPKNFIDKIRYLVKKAVKRAGGYRGHVRIKTLRGGEFAGKTAGVRRSRPRQSVNLPDEEVAIYSQNISLIPTPPSIGMPGSAIFFGGTGVRRNNNLANLTPDEKRHLVYSRASTVMLQARNMNTPVFNQQVGLRNDNAPPFPTRPSSVSFQVTRDNQFVGVTLTPRFITAFPMYQQVENAFGRNGSIVPLSINLVIGVRLRITRYPGRSIFKRDRYSVEGWPRISGDNRIMGRRKLNARIREWREHWLEKRFN